MDILRWIEASDGADHAGRLADDLIYRVVATVGLPYQWSLANVMNMFRRLNTAGTRMGADEVEDALRRAIQNTASPFWTHLCTPSTSRPASSPKT
jgi:hypothetical protein